MKLKMLPYLIPFVMASGHANAAFYVDEDNPRHRTQHMASAASYDVPFFINRTQFGPLGRSTMQALLPQAHKAEVVIIIGRRDPFTAPNEAVAAQRAFRIKGWLINNGIPAHKIELRDDPTVKPSNDKYIFNSEVLLSTRANAMQLAPEHRHTATMVGNGHNPYFASQARAASAPVRQEQSNDSTKLALISKILALGQNKLIRPEDVITLLAELLQDTPTNLPTPQPLLSQRPLPTSIGTSDPMTAVQIQAGALLSIQPAPTPAMPDADPIGIWVLDSNKSLRENLENWISQAGWNKLDWQPTNPYQITFSSTLQGTLLEVLAQIAKAIPELDLQISRRKREIRVIQGTR